MLRILVALLSVVVLSGSVHGAGTVPPPDWKHLIGIGLPSKDAGDTTQTKAPATTFGGVVLPTVPTTKQPFATTMMPFRLPPAVMDWATAAPATFSPETTTPQPSQSKAINGRLKTDGTSQTFVATAESAKLCQDTCRRQHYLCYMTEYQMSTGLCRGYDRQVRGTVTYDPDSILSGVLTGTTERKVGWGVASGELLYMGESVANRTNRWDENECTQMCQIWPTCSVSTYSSVSGRCRLYGPAVSGELEFLRDSDTVSTVITNPELDRLPAFVAKFTSKLPVGELMMTDEMLMSTNQKYAVRFLKRGALALTRIWDSRALWSTGRSAPDAMYAYLMTSGRLGLFNATYDPVWVSPTNSRLSSVAYFGVTDDGKVGTFTANDQPVWTADMLPEPADESSDDDGCFLNMMMKPTDDSNSAIKTATDADDCLQQCQASPNCRVANFLVRINTCLMYSISSGKLVSVTNATLCVTWKSTVVRHEGAIYGGEELLYHGQNLGDWYAASRPGMRITEGHCFGLCYAHSACSAVTFDRINQRCVLKRAGGLVRYDSNAASMVYTPRSGDSVGSDLGSPSGDYAGLMRYLARWLQRDPSFATTRSPLMLSDDSAGNVQMETPEMLNARLTTTLGGEARTFITRTSSLEVCQTTCQQMPDLCYVTEYQTSTKVCIGYASFVTGTVSYDPDFTLSGVISATAIKRAGVRVTGEELLFEGRSIADSSSTWDDRTCTLLCLLLPQCSASTFQRSTESCRLYPSTGEVVSAESSDYVTTGFLNVQTRRLPKPTTTITTKLWPGDILSPGELLMSPNQKYQVSVVNSNALVMTRAWDNRVLWDMGSTAANATDVYFSAGGMVALFNTSMQIVWSSPVALATSDASYFGVTNEGQLGTFTASDMPVWSAKILPEPQPENESTDETGCFSDTILLNSGESGVAVEMADDLEDCTSRCRANADCLMANYMPLKSLSLNFCNMYGGTNGRFTFSLGSTLCVMWKSKVVRHEGAIYGGAELTYHGMNLGDWYAASRPRMAITEGTCFKICYAHPNCSAVTYDKTARRCILKRAGGLVRYDSNFSSLVYTPQNNATTTATSFIPPFLW